MMSFSLASVRPVFALFLLLSGCATGVRAPASESNVAVDLAAILKECHRGTDGETAREDLKVNGNLLTSVQAKNVQWISRCVVPNLPGSADAQAKLAARAAWWALREGILSRSGADVFRYSNCHESTGDRYRTSEPFFVCPDPKNAWQVGIAGGQVPNYSDAKILATFERVFPPIDPRMTESDALKWTANLAGFPEKSPTGVAIAKSVGRLRRSWMIRNPLVGFVLVAESEVEVECLRQKKPWCFAGKYTEATRFAKSETAMRRSIEDLRKIFLGR